MEVVDAMKAVKKFFEENFSKDATVVSVIPQENEWMILAEIVEEDEYMRKKARNDLLALYNLVLNSNLEILSFQRKGFRERGSSYDG